ncbi:MAG: hypothetical protein OXM62_03135 [bacterium]|nr:hypothetical protein [bacterium]
MNGLPVVTSDVTDVLERWRPANWNKSDLRTLEALLPAVRGWVRQTEPSDAAKTRRLLLAASGIAVWALRSFGNTDPTVVFHPSNIEAWTMTVCSDKSMRWRETTRSRLRAMGRVVNPDGWPSPTRQVGRQQIAQPYKPVEERVFRLVGGLPGGATRRQRLWIVCGSLGAGLRGTEIAACRTGDLENIADGRLAVRVRGRHPRLVPIRADYTDLAQAAISASAKDRLVFPDSGDVVHTTARRLRPALSFRRARSTWLVAHLTAGTPLGVLRRVAGPVALSTLDELLPFAADAVDDQTAALKALGA